jgi:hypothetical protein
MLLPLFTNRCGSCHGQTALAGLNLTSYESTMSGSENGAVIIPGDPQASLLIQKQTASQPHFAQLSQEELELVEEWISAGAPK